MTLNKIAPNAYIVEHQGRQCTFVNHSFAQMIQWAKDTQRLNEVMKAYD